MEGVRFAAPDTDAFVESVVRHVGEFEERSGLGLPPLGPEGRRVSKLWTWSLVLNRKSKNKANAWRFIEWAAGKAFLLRSAFEGNMNPTRGSVWEADRFRAVASGWGNFYEVARELVAHSARVLVSPASRYLRLADRWVTALRSAYEGREGVAEALQRAAADIDALIAEPE
jgi:multiple sugar transport system substrate-binding protein